MAALDMANSSGPTQDSYTALNEAVAREDLAYRNLYYALLPSAYLALIPQA